MSSMDIAPAAGEGSETATAGETSDVPARPAPSRRLELGTAAVAGLGFAIALYLALSIPIRAEAAPGQIDARFWPTVLAGIGLLLSVARLVTSLVAVPEKRDDLDPRQPGGLLRVGLTLLVTVLFLAVWSVGEVIIAGYRIQIFPIVMALYLAILMALHGARGWKPFVFFPIPLAIGTYILFGTLLRIPL